MTTIEKYLTAAFFIPTWGLLIMIFFRSLFGRVFSKNKGRTRGIIGSLVYSIEYLLTAVVVSAVLSFPSFIFFIAFPMFTKYAYTYILLVDLFAVGVTGWVFMVSR